MAIKSVVSGTEPEKAETQIAVGELDSQSSPSSKGNDPKDNNVDLEKVEELDAGAKFLLEHADKYSGYTDAEARKVLRKIDWNLMPIMTLAITFAAADKIVISNAALYGMKVDANLVGQQYSWIGSIFYFGYLIMELPANIMLQKLPVGKCLAGSFVFWVSILMIMAAGHNFGSLAALRFLLGMGETFLFPASSVITSMFYKKSEQPIRNAIWFSGFSSLVTGILSYAIGHASSAIPNWKLLFLVFGCITFAITLGMFYFIPDSPMTCRWLTEKERYIAVDRTKSNRTGTKNSTLKKDQVIEALTDPKSWLMCLFVLCFNIPNGALVTFAAQIVNGFGYGLLQTTLLGMPTGVFMTASSWVIALSTLKTPKKYKSIAIALIGLVPLVCAVVLMKVKTDDSNRTGMLFAYYFFYFYWGPYVGMLSLSMANTSGHTKKTIINAMNFISYCVSNIIAPQFFKSSEAPTYHTGYGAILGFVSCGCLTILVYGSYCIYENKRRDRVYGAPATEFNPDEDSLDLTDRQKEAVFRYSW